MKHLNSFTLFFLLIIMVPSCDLPDENQTNLNIGRQYFNAGEYQMARLSLEDIDTLSIQFDSAQSLFVLIDSAIRADSIKKVEVAAQQLKDQLQ